MIYRNILKQSVGIIIMFLLIVMSNLINGQPLSNNFSVGNYLEIFNNDSIKIYYNCSGAIVEKRCAAFFRKGKIDSIYNSVAGQFKDYYITGEILFIGTMRYGKLNGIGTYLFRNGNVGELGVYNDNTRIGEWKYFYSNGKPLKVFNFDEGEPTVVSYYDTAGVQRVNNGFGNYEGFFNGNNQCSPFMISGKIFEGKKDSVWSFSGIDSELYDKGRFIPGIPGSKNYKQYPAIRLQGYVANEDCSIENTHIGCPGDHNIFFEQYKGEMLVTSFYPTLERKMKKLINSHTKHQWVMIGIEIDKDDKLRQVNVHSSINDIIVENIIHDLINNLKGSWEAAKVNNERVETNILLTLTINNDKIPNNTM